MMVRTMDNNTYPSLFSFSQFKKTILWASDTDDGKWRASVPP